MPDSHAHYTELSIHSWEFNPRKNEINDRKREVWDSIVSHYQLTPDSVLFWGFSPLIFACTAREIYLTQATEYTKKFLVDQGIKYTYIDLETLTNSMKKFHWVIATDEFFTFANSDQEQQQLIGLVCQHARDLVITTLRDYKNQDFRDREFSMPLAVHNNKNHLIFLEYHDSPPPDRGVWDTRVWMLSSDSQCHGPWPRRAMFFKQLAKFSLDAGAENFYVHKNIMYKSLIKKNYEHVISIKF